MMLLPRLLLVALVVALGGYLIGRYRQNPREFRYHALHLVLWGAAIVSLSGCFAAFRRFTGEQPNTQPGLNLMLALLYAGVLVIAFLSLGFFMYREDSRTGKLKRKLTLYERFMEQT